MPEMTFSVRWPGGEVQQCYSPSLVVHDHLEVGAEYSVEEFTSRCRSALNEASDRVRAKFGMACTSALSQLADIEDRAAGTRGTVRVLALEPPLPQEEK